MVAIELLDHAISSGKVDIAEGARVLGMKAAVLGEYRVKSMANISAVEGAEKVSSPNKPLRITRGMNLVFARDDHGKIVARNVQLLACMTRFVTVNYSPKVWIVIGFHFALNFPSGSDVAVGKFVRGDG